MEAILDQIGMEIYDATNGDSAFRTKSSYNNMREIFQSQEFYDSYCDKFSLSNRVTTAKEISMTMFQNPEALRLGRFNLT